MGLILYSGTAGGMLTPVFVFNHEEPRAAEEQLNSKLEIRNPKQIPMPQIPMIQKRAIGCRLGHYGFDIVSDFDIRISCLGETVYKIREIDGQ